MSINTKPRVQRNPLKGAYRRKDLVRRTISGSMSALGERSLIQTNNMENERGTFDIDLNTGWYGKHIEQ